MDGIRIEVTGNIARIIERPARITAGTVGLPVEFSFDNQWEGLSKTAVFKAGCTEMIVENLEAETTVPWEITANPNVWLSVGVYGANADGSVAIPTIWANVCVICDGVNPDGDVSTAPTLPVWQRLWNSIGNLLGLTTNAKGNLVEAINEVNSIALAGGIESDTTLTQSGKAADAKATGDAIKSLTAEDVGAAPIPHSASGEVISVADSGHAPLQGLKIYGKTTQNGTPTPETPVPLKSAGESGSIGVTVAGKNLFDESHFLEMGFSKVGEHEYYDGRIFATGKSLLVNTMGVSGSFTLSCKLKYFDAGNGSVGLYGLIYYTDGTTESKRPATVYDQYFDYSFVTNPNKTVADICFTFGSAACSTHVKDFQIEIGNAATAYEPYKGQTATFSAPIGLPGVPINANYWEKPNYTDENGQGWICDEVDFARGVYVQRVKKITTLPAATSVSAGKSASFMVHGLKAGYYPLISDRYQGGNHYLTANNTAHGKVMYIIINDNRFTDVDTCNAIIAEEKPEFLCLLDQPIETPLSAEELAAYAALHSNKPNTTVFNDGGADMEIRYCTPNAAVPMNVGSGAKGKVLSVDEHGCVVPQNVTSVGAAPAGHGLGSGATGFALDDIDNLKTNGWYYTTSANGYYIGSEPIYYILVRVDSWKDTAGMENVCQTIFHGERRVRRVCNRGIWGEWEWENPPMLLGEEYRTTERWNGKAVYSKAISFGELPNGTLKAIEVQTPGIDDVVDYWGKFTNGTSGAVIYGDSNLRSNYSILGDKVSFTIEAPTGSQAYLATIVLKYTKV